MPQQVGKFDFTGIPAAGQADFEGIPKAQPIAQTQNSPAPLPIGAAAPMQNLDLISLFKPENWPAIVATLGGALGGAGGTAFGVGFGGIPGAVGGATLGGGAGEAAKQLANRALGRVAPATHIDAALDIGKEGAIQGAIEGVGHGIVRGAKVGSEALYRGYLKPALNAIDLPKAREIVATALREALPISKAGEDRAAALISDINKQVNNFLGNVTGKVDLHQVAERVRKFAKSKYYKPGVDTTDFKAAMDVADTIDRHPSLVPKGARPTRIDVSPTQANEIKQAVRPNSRAYGQQGSAPEAATRKVAGHELRVDLEGLAPQIGPLNNRERQIIDAVEAVQRAAGREANRNALFGVPTVLSAVGGGAYGAANNDPTTGLLLAVGGRLLLTPAVMSRAAILASRFARIPGTLPAAAVRMAIKVAESESEQQPQQAQ